MLLVTIERYSFTTKILLAPYNFLRLHEIVQMIFIISLTVLVPTLILREVSDNFQSFKHQKSFFLALIFILGIYFYATGNGLHEVSSFNFNQYCNIKQFSGNLCSGFFFNDYYTGNIFYFVGGFLMTIPLLVFEYLKPIVTFKRNDMLIALTNACVYALAIFAYSAFDRVLVGLVYSIITTIVSGVFFYKIRKNYQRYPVITYTTITYVLGTIAAIIVRSAHF